MTDNHFVVLIGSRNNALWVETNINSVKVQDYKNFHAIYYDDHSDDNTLELARNFTVGDDRFTVIGSDERKYKTWFFANLDKFYSFNENDILIFLDGDDFFYAENVLSYLNEIYKQTSCWMTYGGMLAWEGGDNYIYSEAVQNSIFPPEVVKARAYRKDMWRTSHLKTMRSFVWNRFNKSELIPNGKPMIGPDDFAIMFAALEMTPHEKLFRVTEPIYVYNHSQENEKSRTYTEQRLNGYDAQGLIRGTKPYDEISVVSPTLAGGLGNQMFEVAAAASLAKDNGALLMINPNEHILPNQGRNVNNYLSNIFSKIATDAAPPVKAMYSWEHASYKPIPYQPNVKLGGHYQSFKYFDHNRDYIRNLFIPNGFSPNHYEFTAIQVRRGDYWKFPLHHPQLTPDYYVKAVKMAGCKNLAIYSDDIPWCEANLNFGPEYYVQYVKRDTDWEELLNMIGSKNIVISNSSFGWWAAYLNTRKDAQIFVPSVWFGPAIVNDGFKMEDLILPNWNIVQL